MRGGLGSDGSEEWSPARRVVASTAFPLVLSGSVAAALLMMERGLAAPVAFLVATVTALLAIVGLELCFPHRRRWLRSVGDLHVDVAFALTDGVLLEGLRPLLLVGGVALSGWLAADTGPGPWPHGWPILAQLALALVVAELPKYWVHRWMHEYDFLWRFHAVHHSVPRLYWLNASRFHPVDIGLDTIVGVGTLLLLGCGEVLVALFLLVGAVHGAFQHSNLSIRCGPLNWFFSMAELHRWHHSRTVAEANHNYGQNLIVWDAVFGTRFLPRDREPPDDVGLADLPDFPTDFPGQLAAPFRWGRIRGRSPEPQLAGPD